MNQTIIGGHLGADPEVRFTSSGHKVTTLRVAAKARRGSKDKEDTTIWWRVTVWGEHLDKIISYLKKGSSVMVIGEMSKPEIFTDRDGKSQVSMNLTASDLQFSPFGRTDSERKEHSPQESSYASMEPAVAVGQGKDVDFSDDEIPF